MRSEQKRRLVLLALKTIVFSGLLLGAYYQWWLKPRLELPHALASAEQLLATRQASLLQNRLALLELLRFDPASATLEMTQRDLLSRINAAREEGEKLLAQEIPLPSLKGLPSEQVRFVNSDLPHALNQLRDQHRAVLGGQKELYERLAAFHQQTAKLYQYNPADDMGGIDVTTETQAILTRAQAAYEGLGKISEALKTTDLPAAERSQLNAVLMRSRGQLIVLTEAARRGNPAEIEAARSSFINDFTQVKKAVLSAQNSFITSDAAVAHLTQHTNVLLSYNFWLVKINEQRAKFRR